MTDRNAALIDGITTASAATTILDHTGVVAALDGKTATIAWLMRAQDQGRPSGSNYTVWISVNPDFGGAGYATGTPTPTGAMVAGSVVATRIE